MSIGKALSGIASALALVSTSSLAAVAPLTVPNPAPVNPFAIIGVYGSPAAAQALCGNAATAAVAGAAAAQAPGAGCVLPVTDPVVPPPAAEPVPAPVEPVAVAGGPGITPLLLGLVGIAGLAALIASQNGDDGPDTPTPVSPN